MDDGLNDAAKAGSAPLESADTAPELASAEPHDPYAAWRFAGFGLYLVGWFCAATGAQIQSVAAQWMVFTREGIDPRTGYLRVGVVAAVQAAPVILLALPAGQLADHFDRKRVLLLSVISAFFCSLGLAATAHFNGPLWLVYALLCAGSCAGAVGWPARSAMLPQIVPQRFYSNAATWTSSAFQVASVVGPGVGGLIVALHFRLAGATGAFILDALCSLAFIVFLFPIKPTVAPRRHQPVTLRSLMGGIRFVFRAKSILATITLDLFAVLLGGATYLLPGFATDILHVGAIGFGCLRAAPAVGALIAAILLAHRPMRRAGKSLLLAVAGFGLATIVFGFSHWMVLSLVMLALTGAFDNVSVVVRHTLVQMLTPDSMRGRVSAVNNVFIGASNEIGGVESCLTAAWLGARESVVIGGIGTMLVVSAVAVIWPQVAQFGSLQDARPLELPGESRDSSPSATV